MPASKLGCCSEVPLYKALYEILPGWPHPFAILAVTETVSIIFNSRVRLWSHSRITEMISEAVETGSIPFRDSVPYQDVLVSGKSHGEIRQTMKIRVFKVRRVVVVVWETEYSKFVVVVVVVGKQSIQSLLLLLMLLLLLCRECRDCYCGMSRMMLKSSFPNKTLWYISSNKRTNRSCFEDPNIHPIIYFELIHFITSTKRTTSLAKDYPLF